MSNRYSRREKQCGDKHRWRYPSCSGKFQLQESLNFQEDLSCGDELLRRYLQKIYQKGNWITTIFRWLLELLHIDMTIFSKRTKDCHSSSENSLWMTYSMWIYSWWTQYKFINASSITISLYRKGKAWLRPKLPRVSSTSTLKFTPFRSIRTRSKKEISSFFPIEVFFLLIKSGSS